MSNEIVLEYGTYLSYKDLQMGFTEELLLKLRRWCNGDRGRRVIAAKAVGVSRQRVSDWFAGRSKPTSEQILAVQAFLKRRS